MLGGFFNFKARSTYIFESFNELIDAGYLRVCIQIFFWTGMNFSVIPAGDYDSGFAVLFKLHTQWQLVQTYVQHVPLKSLLEYRSVWIMFLFSSVPVKSQIS
jgi:hypothetical protein